MVNKEEIWAWAIHTELKYLNEDKKRIEQMISDELSKPKEQINESYIEYCKYKLKQCDDMIEAIK